MEKNDGNTEQDNSDPHLQSASAPAGLHHFQYVHVSKHTPPIAVENMLEQVSDNIQVS